MADQMNADLLRSIADEMEQQPLDDLTDAERAANYQRWFERLVEWKVSEPRRARRLQNDVNALERKCRKLGRENRKLQSQLNAAQGGGDV